jgi:hypothetical protein
LTLTVPGVYHIANATAALLTLNYFTYIPVTLSYRVNTGPWHDQLWPFGACSGLCSNRAIAMPVPLFELQPGTNIVQIKSSDVAVISNIDLMLDGAAGGS